MRMLYGLKDSSQQSNEDNGKVSFVDKIKNQLNQNEIKNAEESQIVEMLESEGNIENQLPTITDAEIEESLNHEGVDGLLQWVENLPDEVSGNLKDFRDMKSRESYIQV